MSSCLASRSSRPCSRPWPSWPSNPQTSITLTEPNLFLEITGFLAYLEGYTRQQARLLMNEAAISAVAPWTKALNKVSATTMERLSKLQGHPILEELNHRSANEYNIDPFKCEIQQTTLRNYMQA
ncbi:hypothetical protein CDEST_06743 [Colletotrichum destructivum]|uniref:Uncharacterized protein n=1 Tax=Colletotrichum destructivum TaxID=34406 RepID=A0AAX4IFQ2_9PEZI|nr:hypothetical protein CDEST_06743 [Colletotrichum destructivum]